MDRSNPQIARFVGTLAALDDEALAALANKGLVRRARKDLEKLSPEIASTDESGVTLSLEGQTVRLISPAGKSTCTCSSGICRHVLACIMYLRELSAGETGPADATAEAVNVGNQLVSIDDVTMQQWAPKAVMKRAAMVLSHGYEVVEGPVPMIRLPGQNVTIRLMGVTPESMICSCHAPSICEHKVAAVLAYRAHRTGATLNIPHASLEASAGAPRSRDEVRLAVLRLMHEMLILGLSRVSDVTRQRLRTLATSAHGADLPRLERLLKSLADEVTLSLARDAAASSAAMLASASRIAALCHALDRPTTALVGEHRSTYMPVAGSLELVGLGARRWRTRSGYHGLTVLLWEPASKRWTGWTDARPVDAPGFDPVRRFDEDGPWPGSLTPRQVAMSKWRLTSPHRNAAGRIASRSNTRGFMTGGASPADGPLITDFTQLNEMTRQAFAPGLSERRDHSDLVLLAPVTWLDATYDPITQETVRPAVDANGVAVRIALRHSPETEHALTTLERADAATLRAVLGSLRLDARGVFVEPITLWTDIKPIHLTLDSAPVGKALPAKRTFEEPPDEVEEPEEDEEGELGETMTNVGHVLRRAESEMLGIAEGGVEAIRDLSLLRQLARDCSAVGLSSCARSVELLIIELDRFRKSTQRNAAKVAERLLRAVYVIRLAADWTTVCVASHA